MPHPRRPTEELKSIGALDLFDDQPDLLLYIKQERTAGAIALKYHLHISNPALGELIEKRSYDLHYVQGEVETYFSALFKSVERITLGSVGARRRAEQRMAGIGIALFQQLLPLDLQTDLWLVRTCGKRLSRSLVFYVLSNESWIPWELLKLQNPELRGGQAAGPFFVEEFAITRWMAGFLPTLQFSLRHLALVVPGDSRLESAAAERFVVHQLESDGHEVEDVPARYNEIMQRLGQDLYDGWHFAGHGLADDPNPHLWGMLLEENEKLTPFDLKNVNLSRIGPWIFINACHSGRGGYTLTGISGLATAFIEAGAGIFIGSHWALMDDRALAFAITLYKQFLSGLCLGEAMRKTRLWFKNQYPGDPTWLAYTVFGHPLAVASFVREKRNQRLVVTGERSRAPTASSRRYLMITAKRWLPGCSPPGALFRPEYGVAPFHLRDEELADLLGWCKARKAVQVRLYTGPGGIGKTRLALEVCRTLRERGWQAGFVSHDAPAADVWRVVSNRRKPILLVVDHAESRGGLLSALLREILSANEEKIRLLLLARAVFDRWNQLKGEEGDIGELLNDPTTSRHSLRPLAMTFKDRKKSYMIAGRALSDNLGLPPPEHIPEDINAPYFERVLLLHMQALLAIESINVRGEDNILDCALRREQLFWMELLADQKLSPNVTESNIDRAMAAITLGGGVETQEQAIQTIGQLACFAHHPEVVLADIVRLLHRYYPGDSRKQWIEPLQPDLLGRHLIKRQLEAHSDDLFQAVLRSPNRR